MMLMHKPAMSCAGWRGHSGGHGVRFTRFLYEGGEMMAEYSASAPSLRRFVHGPRIGGHVSVMNARLARYIILFAIACAALYGCTSTTDSATAACEALSRERNAPVNVTVVRGNNSLLRSFFEGGEVCAAHFERGDANEIIDDRFFRNRCIIRYNAIFIAENYAVRIVGRDRNSIVLRSLDGPRPAPITDRRKIRSWLLGIHEPNVHVCYELDSEMPISSVAGRPSK